MKRTFILQAWCIKNDERVEATLKLTNNRGPACDLWDGEVIQYGEGGFDFFLQR